MAAQTCAARVVVLGASNVALGFRPLLAAASAEIGEAFDLYAAYGHGRSYGVSTRVLGRGLCGIRECALWPALAAAPPARTYAIACDLGNDVAYGSRPERVVEWLDACLERLCDARVVVVGPPLERIARSRAWSFWLASRVLFPGRRLARDRVLADLAELSERARKLARARASAWIEPPLAWYGLDPIHVARARRAEAWRAIVGQWRATEQGLAPAPHVGWRGRLAPARRTMWGLELARGQPCAKIRGGGAIHLY
jgi:hypothetical protein